MDRRTAAQAVLEQVGLLGPLRRELGRCAEPDLHQGAATLLWQLAGSGPARMRDLAHAQDVDLSVVSRQVGELVVRDLVRRDRDPDDGRACRLSLTPAGRTALDTVLGRVIERFQDRLAGWDDADLHHLAAGLQRLRESTSDDLVTRTSA